MYIAKISLYNNKKITVTALTLADTIITTRAMAVTITTAVIIILAKH